MAGALLAAAALTEAWQHFEQALHLRPDYARACDNLRRLQDRQSTSSPGR